jgi:perosamine synthetase
MDEILEIARRHDLRVIEDNAESPGGRYKGRLLGTFGDCSCYSFFANKIVTTGEGGALLTNSEEIADRSRMLRDHGMSKSKRYHHLDLGYNYRMTNLQAAVGVGQLERFQEILDARARQMDYYYERLRSIDGVHVREFAGWCSPVHWLTTIRLDDAMDRDAFLGSMRSAGVDCRQMVNPVHRAEHFKSDFDDRDFPQSINASEHSAHLPSALNLSEGQIDFICETVRKAVTKA